jgi:hypothetical protein
MPRPWSSDLQEIHEAYKRRDTLDIYLSDGSTLNLSRGAVTRAGTAYNNSIRSVSDMRGTIDQAVDRITVTCQNVDSQLGITLASNLRLLDYAIADYGKQYQSLRNPALLEDIPQMLRGVLANAEADEETITFEIIVDYESLGGIIASRGLGPLCWWVYKNGIECTSGSKETSCPKTRSACIKREVEHENGGWQNFEKWEPTPPAGGGDDGGGIGTGTCFTLDTPIWTPAGEVPIGDLQPGMKIVSFDEATGVIDPWDEIVEVLDHEATGYYTFEFEHGTVEVTREHPFLIDLGRFAIADDLRLGSTVKTANGGWGDSKLLRIKWHSDLKAPVRNLHVKKNHTYFANRCAVHNVKPINTNQGDGGYPQGWY